MKTLKLMWMFCMHSYDAGYYPEGSWDRWYAELGMKVTEKDLIVSLEEVKHEQFWAVLLYLVLLVAGLFLITIVSPIRIIKQRYFTR